MTVEELENRLLKIIISVDAPQLERENNSLVLKCAEDSRSLYETENKILDVLSGTNKNILEDEIALQTLNDSKVIYQSTKAEREKSTYEETFCKRFRYILHRYVETENFSHFAYPRRIYSKRYE